MAKVVTSPLTLHFITAFPSLLCLHPTCLSTENRSSYIGLIYPKILKEKRSEMMDLPRDGRFVGRSGRIVIN